MVPPDCLVEYFWLELTLLDFFFFLNLLKADLSSFSVRPSMEPHRFAALRKGFDDVY